MDGLNIFLTVLSVFSTACAIIFGYAAFTRNRSKDTKEEAEAKATKEAAAAKMDATVLSEIGYIKSNTDEIKAELREQRKVNTDVNTRLTAVEASAKQAHKRIDGIEGHHRPE